MARPQGWEDARVQARDLRNDATIHERMAWQELKGRRLGVRFRRQVPIGPYIVDFACLERKLVIEIDGSVHDYADESVRTAFIEAHGFTIIRFTNTEVEIYGVGNSVRTWLAGEWR